jgi:hypothetical protein
MQSLFEPLARPLVIVIFGTVLGLTVAVSRALGPNLMFSDQNPVMSGLITGAAVVLVLGLVTMVHDAIVFYGGPGEPTDTDLF